MQEKYKHAEENYGPELLKLVVAEGYLTKLMENEAVWPYVARHGAEILEQLELVLNTVSMEKVIEQAELGRAEHDRGCGSDLPSVKAYNGTAAISDPRMDGQLGEWARLGMNLRNVWPTDCHKNRDTAARRGPIAMPFSGLAPDGILDAALCRKGRSVKRFVKRKDYGVDVCMNANRSRRPEQGATYF